MTSYAQYEANLARLMIEQEEPVSGTYACGHSGMESLVWWRNHHGECCDQCERATPLQQGIMACLRVTAQPGVADED